MLKLNKEETLDLVKVIEHYLTLPMRVRADTLYSTLSRMEDYLLQRNSPEPVDEEQLEDEETDDEEDEEEADGNEEEEDPGEEDDEEPGESPDETSLEADDEGESADAGSSPPEEELEPDAYVRPADLHRLTPAKAEVISSAFGAPGVQVMLEFEDVSDEDANAADLLVSGSSCNITHLKRLRSEIHVREAWTAFGGSEVWAWHRFQVDKLPKGWAKTLPLNQLVEID